MNVDWRGNFVDTDELRLHFVRAGSGAPVVFLHGWPEFARAFLRRVHGN